MKNHPIRFSSLLQIALPAVLVFMSICSLAQDRITGRTFATRSEVIGQHGMVAGNAEVVGIASKLLIIAAIFQISDGIQVVVLGALRGLQDVKVPMYMTFVAYWVLGFPISFYLGIYTDLGAVGVWIGLLVGLTAAAIFLYIRFTKLTKKLILKNTIKPILNS